MEDQTLETISCMIVDDEVPAHKILGQYIDQVSWLRNIEGAYRALDALDKIPILNPGILFLDVEMPDLNGLRLLELIKKRNFSVIITSAHVNFAVDGYLYGLAGFLLKPIIFEKFVETMVMVRDARIHGAASSESMLQNLLPVTEPTMEGLADYKGTFPAFHKNSMWLKVEKRIVQMDYTEVTFVEGAKNYVIIYCGDQISYTRVPISEMIRKLPPWLFVQTNRSFIVNRLEVKEIDGNEIVMSNNFRVKVSKELRLLVLDKLTKFNG